MVSIHGPQKGTIRFVFLKYLSAKKTMKGHKYGHVPSLLASSNFCVGRCRADGDSPDVII